MPLLLEFNYTDGSKELKKIPAEAWKTSDTFSKVFMLDKELSSVIFDPEKVTTDINPSDNMWPNTGNTNSKFDNYKNNQ